MIPLWRIALAWLLVHAACGASPWDLSALEAPPPSQPSAAHDAGGVKAIFYDGLPWKGRPTKVFAYYGIPPVKEGEKVPAMVLVHGGGGSAFIPWVKLWMDRGYAAISMDTCGAVSGGGNNNHARHENGGPPGWGGFQQVDEALEDQWPYHAVADVILAHSWIRSRPEVDAARTGITGISWGGYLTSITAGVDHRFRFAAPVYGCGFITTNSTWLPAFAAMGPEKAGKWRGNWDPAVYLPDARMPVLWVTGTNDFAYPLDSLQLSYRAVKGPHFLAVRPRMPHGHGGAGENPEEILAMADAYLKGGPAMPQVAAGKREGRKVSAVFTSPVEVVSATLHHTREGGAWHRRKWEEMPAAISGDTITAEIPEGTRAYYLNIADARGRVASGDHEELGRTVSVKDTVELVRACSTALPGDEIVLAKGVYRLEDRSRILISGRPGPVTLSGYTGKPADVVIEGLGQDDKAVQVVFELTDSPGWTFRDLTTRNTYYHGFKFNTSSTGCVLRNVVMRDHGESGVKGTSDPARDRYPDGLLVEGCDIGFTKPTGGTRSVVEGIDGVAVKGWVIRNNRFVNIQKNGGPAYGAFTKGNSMDTVIEGNRFENCFIGASFGGGGTGGDFFRDHDKSAEHRWGVIRGNTFTGCTDAAIYINRGNACRIERNEIIRCGAAIQLRYPESTGWVEGNVVKEPVNPADPPVRLRDGAVLLGE